MKKLLLTIGLASGAVGATLSVADVTIQPFCYEFETLLRALTYGLLTAGAAVGIASTADMALWDPVEIASNTVLSMLGGPGLFLVLHLGWVKWRDWARQPGISMGRKLALLAAAWGVTLIASLASGQVASARDFVQAVVLFPFATLGFVRVPWAYPLVGWVLYLSITTAAALTPKRRWYFGLYALLCILLALNVVGCHKLK